MLLLISFGLGIVSIPLGVKHQHTFDLIKEYLFSILVLKEPKSGFPFRLYISSKDKVIGVVLTQETEGKEHIIAYLSHQLVNAEIRYTFIEKYVYACFMHAPSLDIIYYLALALFPIKPMSLNICCKTQSWVVELVNGLMHL
jgi:hypothetical protein